jgi:hypothetical protein
MCVAVVRRLLVLAVLGAAAVALVATTQGAAAPRVHARTAKFPIAQFTCYKGEFGGFKRAKFTISNQFDKLSAGYLVAPLRVCAPAIKNSEPIPDKRSHLVCFTIRVANGPTGTRKAIVTDQFGVHKLFVIVSEPESICLPASKSRTGTPSAIPTRLDHYVCYPVKPASPFTTKTVSLRDQFGLGKEDAVFAIRTLCAPTSKNRAPFVFKTVHLLCYDVKSPVKGANVVVREQFGLMKAALALRDRLCEPALKKLVQ